MAKNWAIVFGVVFVIVGLLGLIGGAGIVGPDGFFSTNGAHDWVHILTGLIFLIVAFAAPQSSAGFLKVFGIIYLIVAVLGFLAPSVLGFLDVNGADNLLHLVLGIIITWAGFAKSRDMSMPMSA